MSRPALSGVVGDGEPTTLGAWLEQHAPDTSSSLADGRVFVDGKRVTDAAHPLATGGRIELFAARKPDGDVQLLARFEGLVAVEKPAGMATEPDHAGIGGSLVARAAELLGVARDDVHALSRLDVGVSGVVLLALDAPARRGIEALRRAGRLRRRYVAIASAAPQPALGLWQGAIGRARGSRRAVGGRDADAATTRYRTVATAGSAALLALEPVTGRTHQLRVHAAHAGCPLYGDPSYGGPKRVVQANGAVVTLRRIALHAAWVELPWGGGVRVESALPVELEALWSALGGAAPDLDRAVTE